MSISYAGCDLLLVTADLDDWLARHGGYDELQHLCPWHEAEPKYNHDGASHGCFKPPINRLYWPTGASRLSLFHGLADTAAKKQIVKAVQAAGVRGRSELVLGDGTRSVHPDMYLLPPRPLTCRGPDDQGALWLIPLVDERYWWQFASTGDLSVAAEMTWAELYQWIGLRLGTTIQADTVDADYLYPDSETLSRRYANVAALLDAIAESVGQRIVRHIGQNTGDEDSTKAVGWPASRTWLGRNLDPAYTDDWTRAAGDAFDDEPFAAAEKVIVAFRKAEKESLTPDGELKTYQVNPDDGDFPAERLVNGTVYTVHSMAIADHTTNGLDGAPDNDADLQALADRIAADYYAGRKKQFDYTFNGVKIWHSTGFDDYTEWSLGGRLDRDAARPAGGEMATRVVPARPNLPLAEMCHRDPDERITTSQCCYEAYVSSYVTFTSTPVAAPLDTVKRAADWAEIDNDDGGDPGIRVYGQGWLKVAANATLQRYSSTGEAVARAVVYRNGSVVIGSLKEQGMISAGNGECSTASVNMVDVTPGAHLKLMLSRLAGSATLKNKAHTTLMICPCPGFVFKDSLSYKLAGYWPLEGGLRPDGTWSDWSGNDRHAAINGAELRTGTGGKIGACLECFGSTAGQTLDVADHADLRGDQDFTLSFWVWLENKTVDATFVEKGAGGGNKDFDIQYQQSSDRFRFTKHYGGGSLVAVLGNSYGAPETGKWHHLVFQWDNTNFDAHCWVNNSKDSDTSPGAAGDSTTEDMKIGHFLAGDIQYRIDEVSIFNRLLSDAEVSRLFASGTARRPGGF